MSIAFKRRISGLIAFVMIVSAMLCNAFTAYSESSASPDGSDTVLSSDAVGYDLLANDDGIQLTSAEDGEPVAGETYNVDIKNGDDGGLSTESGSGSWLGGMVTMENATKNGGGHGAQMQSGTKISVKVAGDAKITFYECQYANNTYSITAESETVSPKTMNFGNDKNGCNAPMEFTYTGKATTLVFNVSGTGQAYIHGFNIYNLLPKDEYEYPEKGTTQKYDFTKYVADEGHGLGDDSKYIKINGDVSLNSSDARYGITFSTPVYLLINVAGNAKITLPKDTNNKQGPAVTASALFDGGSIEPSDAQSLQSEEKSCTQFLQNPDSSENVTINYTGEQNVIKLSFAAYRTYMPGVIVENEGDPIPIPEEDYSIDFETEAEAGGLTTAAESKGVWKDGWVSVSSAKKHADNHGIQFGSGTKLSVMVGRNATITFKGCQYTNGQKEGSTLSTSSPDVIPASADAKTTACKDGITFKYEGDEPATIEFTYSNGGTCYLHGIDVVHESTAPPETQGNGKIDVWDLMPKNTKISLMRK